MKTLINLIAIIALPLLGFAQLPASGLVAWYPFCGNTLDYSTNGYNLTNGGSILTADRFGNANCAYHYNGINNSMYLSGLLPLPSTEFTFSCWMIADNIQDGVVVYNGNSNSNGVGIVYDAGSATPGYNVTMLDGGLCFCMSVYATLHQWHHVVLRRSSGTFNLFIDTTLVATSPSSYYTPAGRFTVGMDYTNGTNPYSGTIDDIAVYNRAITDIEVKELYHYNPDAYSFSLGNDTAVCGSAFTLNSSLEPAGTTYTWSDGSSGTAIIVSTAGTYWLTVNDPNGCQASDTINLSVGTVQVNLGPDTGVCPDASLMLYSQSTPASATYLWSNGSTMDSITVGAGTFWVIVSYGGCTATDTIVIAYGSVPVVNLGNDTTICQGSSITLQSSQSNPGAFFQWNTGASTASINVSAAGEYWLEVSKYGCSAADTVNVSVRQLPVLSNRNDTTFCEGQSLKLTINVQAGSTYSWNTGSIDSSITITTAGTYWVVVTDSGCSDSAFMNIKQLTKPLIDLGNDTVLCSGEVLLLSVIRDSSLLSWSDGTSASTMPVTSDGIYWATSFNTCGSMADTIHVNYTNCDLWFPTGFTPNGDGKNDLIRPIGTLNKFKDYSLSIYNRWGQRIFYSKEIENGWDGTFCGVKQDLGTYYYLIHYSLNNKQKMLKGDFELIR